jgi:hypothetical protein
MLAKSAQSTSFQHSCHNHNALSPIQLKANKKRIIKFSHCATAAANFQMHMNEKRAQKKKRFAV